MKGKSKYAISPQSLAKIPSRIQKKSLGEKRSAMDLIDAIYQLLILLTLSILSVTSFRLLKKNCTISREKVRQEEKKLGVVTVCASREGLAPSCHFSYRPSWVVFFLRAQPVCIGYNALRKGKMDYDDAARCQPSPGDGNSQSQFWIDR